MDLLRGLVEAAAALSLFLAGAGAGPLQPLTLRGAWTLFQRLEAVAAAGCRPEAGPCRRLVIGRTVARVPAVSRRPSGAG